MSDNNFEITKEFGNIIWIDDSRKLWTIPEGFFTKKINPNRIYKYKDIKSVEIFEDSYTSKGGIFVEEMCTTLSIRIKLNNNNIIENKIINSKTKKSSFLYKTALEILTEIKNYFDEVLESNSKKNVNDVPGEILKYKKLLDEGIITQKEFELKKKQLLGL